MAFQTKAAMPNLAGMGAMIEKADPFSALGNTMSELDTILDKRAGEDYLKTQDISTSEGMAAALKGSPNDYTRKQIMDQAKTLATIQGLDTTANKQQLELMKANQSQLTNMLKQQQMQMNINEKQGKMDEVEAKRLEAYDKNVRGIQLIDEMMQDRDNMENAVGGLDAMTPDWMKWQGTKDYDAKIKKLKGQTFLQGIEAMKGTGTITEIEGEKATEAMANLSQSQSEDQFLSELQNLRDIYETGMRRHELKYGKPSGPSALDYLKSGQNPNSQGPQFVETKTINGVKYGMTKDGQILPL